MGLMKQELECIEKILKQRRLEVNQPKPPVLDPIADFRLGWNADKLASLKRRRGRAWNWQKAGLDERIRKTEQHIKHLKEGTATRKAEFQSLASDEEKKKLKHLEEQYAALSASLPKPESLVDIEQQIKSTNESIIVSFRAYDEVTKSSQAWETQKEANEKERAADPSLLGGLFDLALESMVDETELRIMIASAGLKLYKLVMYSDYLQNSRDDKNLEYLSEAAAWNPLKLKAEIRKKNSELEAVPNFPLPNVMLFTVNDFPLKNPFVRQRQFLEELIAELGLMTKQEVKQQPNNERKQREKRIEKLRKDRAAVQANQNLDSHERQMRVNMYDDAIENELEKLRSLI